MLCTETNIYPSPSQQLQPECQCQAQASRPSGARVQVDQTRSTVSPAYISASVTLSSSSHHLHNDLEHHRILTISLRRRPEACPGTDWFREAQPDSVSLTRDSDSDTVTATAGACQCVRFIYPRDRVMIVGRGLIRVRL